MSVTGRIFQRVDFVSDLDGVINDECFDEDLVRIFDKLKALQSYSEFGLCISGGSMFTAFSRTLLGDCIVPHLEGLDMFYNIQPGDTTLKASILRTIASDAITFALWLYAHGYVDRPANCLEIDRDAEAEVEGPSHLEDHLE